jgi:hypothetical protein
LAVMFHSIGAVSSSVFHRLASLALDQLDVSAQANRRECVDSHHGREQNGFDQDDRRQRGG